MKHIVLLIVLPSKTTTILQLFATSDEHREYTVMSPYIEWLSDISVYAYYKLRYKSD